MPSWLLLIMALSSTALLATSVSAGMRFPPWRYLAIAAGAGLVGLIVLSHLALLHSVVSSHKTLADAFDSALRGQSAANTAVFLAGIPTFLVLSGLTGILQARGRLSPETPESPGTP